MTISVYSCFLHLTSRTKFVTLTWAKSQVCDPTAHRLCRIKSQQYLPCCKSHACKFLHKEEMPINSEYWLLLDSCLRKQNSVSYIVSYYCQHLMIKKLEKVQDCFQNTNLSKLDNFIAHPLKWGINVNLLSFLMFPERQIPLKSKQIIHRESHQSH